MPTLLEQPPVRPAQVPESPAREPQPVRRTGFPLSWLGFFIPVAAAVAVTLAVTSARDRSTATAVPFSSPIPVRSAPAVRGEEIAQLTEAPNVPRPITRNYATRVIVDLEVTEKVMRLADGVQYTFWTFGGSVPGRFIRVREGDEVEFRLKNHPGSLMPHNIDLHAVTGPGGGAEASMALPGQQSVFRFTALNPGLFVYHCAFSPASLHIANGMYGLILVEPKEGMPKVDHEFYVMQSEFYTQGANGASGLQPFDQAKAVAEQPDYVVFNGSVGALMGDHALKVRTGETVRLFVGNGGPNLSSSFHVIGEVFDNVYTEGGTLAQHNVQTTGIPAGGSAVVEFRTETPGKLVLVDHALFRAFNKGAIGLMQVEGAPQVHAFSGQISNGPYTPAAH